MDRLAVAVSEGKLHEVEAPDSFETGGPFVVAITNRGRDSHVHLRLDDALSRVATLAETNPHVPRDETVEIVADVNAVSAPVGGLLTVETGYGADGTDVEVTIDPPAATQGGGGRASSDGGTPQRASTESAEAGGDGGAAATAGVTDALSLEGGFDLVSLAVALLAVGAVGVAVGVASIVADPVVVVGAAAVVLAAGVAAFLLAR